MKIESEKANKKYNVGGNAKEGEFNCLWRENYKHPQMEVIRCKHPITSSDQVNSKNLCKMCMYEVT